MARTIGPDTEPKKKERIKNSWKDFPVLPITRITYQIILKKCEKPADVIGVYLFYAETGMWQDTDQPWCTVSYISKALNIPEVRVRAARKELLRLGVIEDAPRSRLKKGKGFSKPYVKVNFMGISYDSLLPLHINRGIKSSGKCLGTSKGLCLGTGKDKKRKNNKKEKKDGRFEELSIKEWFDKFWTSYPTKQGKKKAEEKWNQALKKNKDLHPSHLITRMELAKETIWNDSFSHPDKKFNQAPCHATTWLHGERWNDELPGDENKPAEKERDSGVDKDLDTLSQYREHLMNSEGAKQVRQDIQKVGSLSRYFAWLSRKVEEGEVKGITMEAIYPGHLFESWAEEMEED